MKIRIVAFSQTGNTRKVADAMKSAFEAEGHAVESALLKKADPARAADCDVFGVGTACFSSRAPQPVLDFLEKIPSMKGKRAFVFATSGGGPGRVLYELAEALRKKGADVVGGIIVRGECFHPFPALYGRFPGRPDERDLAFAAEFVRSVSERVKAGGSGPNPIGHKHALKPGWGFYDVVALLNTDDDLRRTLKAPEVDPASCDKCRLCEKECPTLNITMTPYPALGPKCLRCYRCVTVCPKRTMVADYRVGNLLAHLFYNTIFERYLGDVKAGEKFY